MGRCRFVQPAVVRLPLTDGDWIDIREELTAAEERAVIGRYTKSYAAGERPQLDAALVQIATVVAYVLAWSFVDAEGRPVAVSDAAIGQLDDESFRELHRAITAHEEALAAKKATRRAEPKS